MWGVRRLRDGAEVCLGNDKLRRDQFQSGAFRSTANRGPVVASQRSVCPNSATMSTSGIHRYSALARVRDSISGPMPPAPINLSSCLVRWPSHPRVRACQGWGPCRGRRKASTPKFKSNNPTAPGSGTTAAPLALAALTRVCPGPCCPTLSAQVWPRLPPTSGQEIGPETHRILLNARLMF